jgi:hypothetical protein
MKRDPNPTSVDSTNAENPRFWRPAQVAPLFQTVLRTAWMGMRSGACFITTLPREIR